MMQNTVKIIMKNIMNTNKLFEPTVQNNHFLVTFINNCGDSKPRSSVESSQWTALLKDSSCQLQAAAVDSSSCTDTAAALNLKFHK
jgi:hypothetical protein